jgi:hypothetical protein
MTVQFIAPTKRTGMTKTDITVEYVRSQLDYDPTTGWLVWRVARSGKARAGARAGTGGHWNGYRVLTLGGSQRQEHAVVWMHVYGVWPVAIDHINGDRSDNRISNLRECTPKENAQNRKIDSDNQSGFQGVYRPRGQTRWRAQIKKDGIRHFLGDFDTPEEAHAAYRGAKRVLHPFQPTPRKGTL